MRGCSMVYFSREATHFMSNVLLLGVHPLKWIGAFRVTFRTCRTINMNLLCPHIQSDIYCLPQWVECNYRMESLCHPSYLMFKYLHAWCTLCLCFIEQWVNLLIKLPSIIMCDTSRENGYSDICDMCVSSSLLVLGICACKSWSQ